MKTNYNDMLRADFNESQEIRGLKETEFKKQFSKNLSNFLINNEISAKELSELTNYTVQHCSRIINGKDSSKSLSLFCLYRICHSLDISIDDLWNFDMNVNSPDDSIESKRKSIINKINKIDNIDILSKVLFEINYLNKFSEKPKDNDENENNFKY